MGVASSAGAGGKPASRLERMLAHWIIPYQHIKPIYFLSSKSSGRDRHCPGGRTALWLATVSWSNGSLGSDIARHRLYNAMLVQIVLHTGICRFYIEDNLLYRTRESV